MIIPPIKTQGIKSKLVPWISSIASETNFIRWVEPFCGSGVVAFNVASNGFLADSNPHIINFYTDLKNGVITANSVREFLENEGRILSETKGEHYYTIRSRFNSDGSSLDFLFLTRACFNGVVRFNSSGGFNTPFCKLPERFTNKSHITKIVNQVQRVSDVISSGYVFVNQDYEKTIQETRAGDLIYLDPPYIARHSTYYNQWNETEEKKMCSLLNETSQKFILSTWHHDQHRKNPYLDMYSDFNIETIEHYYHVGGKEINRRTVTEAVIKNF